MTIANNGYYVEGFDDGVKKGSTDGEEKGILAMINFARKQKIAKAELIESLMEEYNISQADADKYVNEYYK